MVCRIDKIIGVKFKIGVLKVDIRFWNLAIRWKKIKLIIIKLSNRTE